MAGQSVSRESMVYPCYVQTKDKRDEWYWVYYARNGEAIARSSEGYENKSDCTDSITLVQKSADAKVYIPADDS